jgi:predicted phosphoribosyltransferase
MLGIGERAIQSAAEREQRELVRRERLYRGERPPIDVRGKSVLLVDDGLATGSSMRAAVHALRRLGPDRIVVAVPVGAEETCRELGRIADEVVCARTPEPFFAVGNWYDDFDQTEDSEVHELLARAGQRTQAA